MGNNKLNSKEHIGSARDNQETKYAIQSPDKIRNGVLNLKIEFLENECWYGGRVHEGYQIPIGENDNIEISLVGGVDVRDQYSPVFISNKGRYIYSDKAFDISFCNGEINIDDKFNVELCDDYETLKGAQLAVAQKYFVLNGKTPNTKFFETPQYNTWIELMYNQNQKQILEYARTMVESGMPAGILMIDEGWAPDYGVYDFDAAKFSNPKQMIEELHEMGFSVMLWVTPLISPDSNCFRELRDTDILIKDKNGKPVIREWWNGFSCVLDFSNPKTREWMRKKLQYLIDKYGVDGFKFDAGDACLYDEDDCTYVKQSPNEHTKSFNTFCGEFEFNELRNVWNCGGVPVVCRLYDKQPAWDETGLLLLIPNMLSQGLLGYYYGCPDMVGGGEYSAFLNENYHTDEELYLRWLAVSLLCPMMQFSISPKRILSEKSLSYVQQLSDIRSEYSSHIIESAKNAAKTGEPIMRYMEYEFPNCGYEKITDQFMLGSDILVAPILKQGSTERKVTIPNGKWKTINGDIINGPNVIKWSAELNELPIFKLCGEV